MISSITGIREVRMTHKQGTTKHLTAPVLYQRLFTVGPKASSLGIDCSGLADARKPWFEQADAATKHVSSCGPATLASSPQPTAGQVRPPIRSFTGRLNVFDTSTQYTPLQPSGKSCPTHEMLMRVACRSLSSHPPCHAAGSVARRPKPCDRWHRAAANRNPPHDFSCAGHTTTERCRYGPAARELSLPPRTSGKSAGARLYDPPSSQRSKQARPR